MATENKENTELLSHDDSNAEDFKVEGMKVASLPPTAYVVSLAFAISLASSVSIIMMGVSLVHLIAAGVFLLTSIILAVFFVTSWEKSNPDEWLVVIENGVMISGGVGMRCFRGFTQTVVRFPSVIRKVHFSAKQVTQQMQGIEIAGFAIWSVYRLGDGPFRAYKYINAGAEAADEKIVLMAESIVRHQIANHSLNEVLTQRALVRDKVRAEMMRSVKGWGVWLETVEITEVKILSRALFEDMQAAFRQSTHLDAEKIRHESRRAIEFQRLTTDMEIAKQRTDTSSQQYLHEQQRELAKQVEGAKMLEQRKELERQRAEKEQEAHMLSLNFQEARKEFTQGQELARLRAKKEHELWEKRAQLELESTWTEANFRKASIDATLKAYERLPIKDMRVYNYTGGSGQSGSGLASLLPGLGAVLSQVNEHKEE